MNIKVGMLFYILSLFLAFFSRKVFLDCLGAEFIGLTGMLMNIMSFLSVAELGIGTSIVYFLYKPLQEDNHEKINEVMSMLAYLYRCIGFFIGAIGIIVSLFFPWWFGHLSIGLPLVYFAFYSFLATTISFYIFNYKQLLVSANQKQYMVSAYFQTINIVQSLTQIILAYYYRNLFLWVVVGLIFTIIGIITFNYRIRQLYPWLQVNLKEGRSNLQKYPEVLKKTRQVFIRKMKDFILYRCDELLVGTFVSITQVAFYGNYTIIINKFVYLVNILTDGMSAGVGNLLAEGNEKNTMKVFWEMMATRFLIMGVVIYSLIMFMQPFISCWVGYQYQLSDIIVYLLIIQLFLRPQFVTVYVFIESAGLYGDVWTSWTELILNIVITLCLAPQLGIVGILLGKVISMFIFNIIWKPYYLFSEGFHKSIWDFWRPMTKYYGIFFLFASFAIVIRILIIDNHVNSWTTLIGYSFVTFPILILFYSISLFIFTNGMKYFIARKPVVYSLVCKLTFTAK